MFLFCKLFSNKNRTFYPLGRKQRIRGAWEKSPKFSSKATQEKLGIEILSCNIQNVQDENGLIQDLGAENTSLIKKNAAIAKAQADRDVAIAQADADKAANDAKVES